MIDYYARVADVILPHLKGRPLTLRRFPEGVGNPRPRFFEKNCPKHRPEWVKTTPIYVDRRAGEIDFCLCENRATLIWMAQLAALELHPSLSKATRMEQPTVLAFDLDPGAAGGPGRVLPGRAARPGAVRRVRARGLPQGLRRQGPAGLLPPQHQGHLRADEPLRESRRPAAREADPEGRRLEDGQGGPPRQGLRRLEPEPPEEDDDRRLFAAGARAPHGLHPAPLARGGAHRKGRRHREDPLRDPGCDQADREGGRPLRAGPQAAGRSCRARA